VQKWRRATPSYLESVQTDMNASMRAILVDWLVEVCQEYRLVSDTLFLAVSYLDRYLSLVPVSRSRLQLVGVTCLLLAAKYEEIYAPQVGWQSGVCFPLFARLRPPLSLANSAAAKNQGRGPHYTM